MQDPHDVKTQDMFPATPKRRGRPSTGNALTGAQRQALYRERHKNKFVTVTINQLAVFSSLEAQLVAAQAELQHSREVVSALQEQVGHLQRTVKAQSEQIRANHKTHASLKGQLTKLRNDVTKS